MAEAATSSRVQPQPKPSSTRTVRGLPNANSFELSRKTLFTDKEILRTILKFVDTDDVLQARLVCSFWNETISSTSSTTVLWPRVRLAFPKGELKPGESSHSINSIQSFENLELIRKYHCPNFRFHRVDLRKDKAQLFFTNHGPYIKHLKLDNCIMSLVTFQRIVHKCPLMESFDVTGLFHCITQTESISSRDPLTICSFPNLQSLTLESTYVRRLLLNLACPDPAKRYHVPTQDLNSVVVNELLSSATLLQQIKISGFGFSTVISVMEALVKYPIHTHLTRLAFNDVSDGMNPETFKELTRQLGHIKLKTFALTYLSGDLDGKSEDPVNMDSAIQEVIFKHGTTLEELDLTHCHVTEKIFNLASTNMKLSKLKTLLLKGTKICKLSRNSVHLMENLEYSEFTDHHKVSTAGRDELLERVARERQTQLLFQAREDFGFHVFTWVDKTCFLMLGVTFLVLVYHLFVESFGDIGKPAFIVFAAGLLSFVQWKRIH